MRAEVGPPIRLIANATDFIETLATLGPSSPAEVAERAAMPRSSAYRLIDGLAAISLVDVLDDGRVRLSARWVALADASRASLTEWSGASGALERLVARTGQTAFLSVLLDDRAVCIDWRRGRGVAVLALKPGRSLPLHAGAAGRVLLAHAADADAYLERAPFERLTAHTLTDARGLRADIDATLANGYVLSNEDVTTGVSAVGIPVREKKGEVSASVSLAGLTSVFEQRRDEFLKDLQDAVHEVERARWARQ